MDLLGRNLPEGVRLVEVSTCGPNPDFYGVGSSPYQGDSTFDMLLVPSPTPGSGTFPNRYSFRLAALSMPPGKRGWIVSIRQAVRIGYTVDLGDNGRVPVSIDQTDPFFYFTDGNISWHLRKYSVVGQGQNAIAFSPPFFPGVNPFYYGTQPGLLYDPLLPAIPVNGAIPGSELAGLGTFHSIRFPWLHRNWGYYGVAVEGGETAALFASVKQTDPFTRPVLPIGPDPSDIGMSQEQLFVRYHPLAQYQFVAGALAFVCHDLNLCAVCKSGCKDYHEFAK